MRFCFQAGDICTWSMDCRAFSIGYATGGSVSIAHTFGVSALKMGGLVSAVFTSLLT